MASWKKGNGKVKPVKPKAVKVVQRFCGECVHAYDAYCTDSKGDFFMCKCRKDKYSKMY